LKMSAVLGISAFFSASGLALFCASIAATSYHYGTIKNTNWVNVKEGSAGHIYIGLNAAAVDFGSTQVYRFDSCGHDVVCERCGNHGGGGEKAEALVSIALIFSCLALIVTLCRFGMNNAGTKVAHIVTALISFTFGIAAFANYSGCYEAVKGQYHSDDDYLSITVSYGPGYGLCVAASGIMVLAFIMGLIPAGEDAGAGGNAQPNVSAVPTSELANK